MSAANAAAARSVGRFEQPFPLWRRFVLYILPGFLILVVFAGTLSIVGAYRLAEGLYLEQAVRRAQIIDRAMNESAPMAWRRLKSGEPPAALYADSDGQRLLAELKREVHELDLTHLTIYGPGGVIQYATDGAKIGKIDRSIAYVAASEQGERSVVLRHAPDGSALYELYVLVATDGAPAIVFELYEAVGHLNALLWRVGTAAALAPSLFLVTLILVVSRLVVLAQRDIDGRARLVIELRGRLERLLSAAASQAVRRAVSAGGVIPSVRTHCTLLYSDIRDFSSFAESNKPEEVMHLLNRLLAMIVGEIDRAGGDVDKLIGDAVLARFQGPGAEARAIEAAQAAQKALIAAALPRGVGIGIFTGEVISGTVGSADRMDFTVIGDSVNLAARLSSAADSGEIVADAHTVEAAGARSFGALEIISVKGRRSSLGIRRWHA